MPLGISRTQDTLLAFVAAIDRHVNQLSLCQFEPAIKIMTSRYALVCSWQPDRGYCSPIVAAAAREALRLCLLLCYSALRKSRKGLVVLLGIADSAARDLKTVCYFNWQACVPLLRTFPLAYEKLVLAFAVITLAIWARMLTPITAAVLPLLRTKTSLKRKVTNKTVVKRKGARLSA
eukprot:651700-Amphidinium_carterae.2